MKRALAYLKAQLASPVLAWEAAAAGVSIVMWGILAGYLAEAFGASGEMFVLGLPIPSFSLAAVLVGVAIGDALLTALFLWVLQRRIGLGAWFMAGSAILGIGLAAFSLPSWADVVYVFGRWMIAAALFARLTAEKRRFVRPALYLAATFLAASIVQVAVLFAIGERVF